jgi:hypothetical protein
MSDVAEVYTTAESVGLPDEVVNNILGVGANDVIAQTNKATADTTQANEVANA